MIRTAAAAGGHEAEAGGAADQLLQAKPFNLDWLLFLMIRTTAAAGGHEAEAGGAADHLLQAS